MSLSFKCSYPEFSRHLRLAACTSVLMGDSGLVSFIDGNIDDGDSMNKIFVSKSYEKFIFKFSLSSTFVVKFDVSKQLLWQLVDTMINYI